MKDNNSTFYILTIQQNGNHKNDILTNHMPPNSVQQTFNNFMLFLLIFFPSMLM